MGILSQSLHFKGMRAPARTCSSFATFSCSPSAAAGLADTEARSTVGAADVGGRPWFGAPGLAPLEPDLAPQPDAGGCDGCRAAPAAARP